jgi:tetratricopeptide (TPR) repeat protein
MARGLDLLTTCALRRWTCRAVAAVLLLGMPCAVQAQTAPGQPVPFVSPGDLDGFEASIRYRLVEARDRADRERSAEALGALGMLLHAYDRFDRAAACYAEARRLAPRTFEWTYYHGVALAAAGDVDGAIAAIGKALAIDSSSIGARLQLAGLQLEQGRLDESVQLYRQVLRDRPSSATAHYGLGRVLSERRDPAAIEHFERAAALAPEFAAAQYSLALAYARRGDRERSRAARAAYEATRQRPPPVEDPLLEQVALLRSGPFEDLARGRTLLARGQHRDAIEVLERAARSSPGLLQAHVNLVAAYGAIGAADKAEAAYAAAAAISPDLPELHYNLGVLRLSQQRTDEAIAAFQRALAGNPAYADAHNNLGFVLAQRGSAGEAVEHFRAALSASPDHRDAHFNLARALLARKDLDEAIVHFSRAASVEDEKTSLYLYHLADAYARAGRAADAEQQGMEARKRAAAYGQTALVERIDDDLRRLRASMKSEK